MGTFEDAIADTVLSKYDTLPSKSKPIIGANGTRTWVPLSGIVATRGNGIVECVALATGMKCLPTTKVPLAHGSVLHDWHAEILALRCFNHFLLSECHSLASSPSLDSVYLRRRHEGEGDGDSLQPFAIDEDVKLHMYCSEAPCGDASMELVMRGVDDATPWPVTAMVEGREEERGVLKGRGYFSELGIVRRKPARADSPPTLSKSCSDKIALKQCTSLLSSLTSVLVSPENAYLQTLILPASEHVPSACKRCFAPDDRLKPVSDRKWSHGYSFQPFQVKSTRREFVYSKRAIGEATSKGSNISAAWNPKMQETLINGVLSGRKQMNPRGASSVSRMSMLRSVRATLKLLSVPALAAVLSAKTYSEFKGSQPLKIRRGVKEDVRQLALAGWVPNIEDDFSLDTG